MMNNLGSVIEKEIKPLLIDDVDEDGGVEYPLASNFLSRDPFMPHGGEIHGREEEAKETGEEETQSPSPSWLFEVNIVAML